MRLMLHNVNRLNYGTREKKMRILENRYPTCFGYPISNIEGAIRFFLVEGEEGGGERGEVMKKLKIKNNLYNFLCLSLYINLIVNKNQTYVSLKMKTEKQ